MQVDVGIWSKLTRLVYVLLFVAGILALCFWYLPLIQQNERMRKEILRLDAQIQKETDARKQLDTSFDTLSSKPKAFERLVRERLGYAKPGETVIRFEASVSNPPPRR